MTIIIGKGVKPVEVLAWGDTLVHTDKTAGEDNAVVLHAQSYGYSGPLSIEWEDLGMDREWGAHDALALVR